jgi:hypothetical protein
MSPLGLAIWTNFRRQLFPLGQSELNFGALHDFIDYLCFVFLVLSRHPMLNADFDHISGFRIHPCIRGAGI